MVRILGEAFGLGSPCFADEFVGCEAAQALETACEVVGGDEVLEVPPELFVAVVVEAFDGRVLDGAVHPFDLTIGPGMVDAGEAVLDAMLLASHGEHMGHVPGCGSVGVTWCKAELDAVVGEHVTTNAAIRSRSSPFTDNSRSRSSTSKNPACRTIACHPAPICVSESACGQRDERVSGGVQTAPSNRGIKHLERAHRDRFKCPSHSTARSRLLLRPK